MTFMRTNRLTVSYRIAVSVTGLPCMQYRDSVATNVRLCSINGHTN